MCEILVRAVNGTCPDPTENPLRGMLIAVRPDGHQWGKCECPPEYVIIKLPSVLISTIDTYARVLETRIEREDAPPLVTRIRRRRYLVGEAIIKAAEANGGTLTRTRNQLTRALIDRAA